MVCFLLSTKFGQATVAIVLPYGSPVVASGRGVQGLPYSGEFVTVRKGARPGAAEWTDHQKVWRDSAGRTREDDLDFPLSDLCDPVAGYSYWFIPTEKLVRRSKTGCAKFEDLPATNVDAESIKLGFRLIEGFAAEGLKTATKVANVDGHGAVATQEIWFSSALKRIIYAKFSDPKDGETTTTLTNIKQTEPDPALFALPAGYTVVEEKK